MSAEAHLGLRLAARAMGRHGLAHAYGHVSSRIDDQTFLVGPPRPLSTVPVDARGTVVSIEAPLPAGVLGEVRIHREIYRRRADVGGICRVQPPALMALSAVGRTPRAVHGLGVYFAPSPPIWWGTALIRDDVSAARVAETLDGANAIVLRGNGAVTTGLNIEMACAHAFFLEDAARIELALMTARAAGIEPIEFDESEVRGRATGSGSIYERMWQFLCFGDVEWKDAA